MSNNENLSIIILAAGKGTRMNSAIPKVLHELAGKPLLNHVVDVAKLLNPSKICVVYGHGGEAVPLSLADDALQFVLQDPQMGTGHAVQAAMPFLDGKGRTLVLYGDVPLIKADTLHQLLESGSGMSLLTMKLANPHGYGRIIRDDAGNIVGIVEEKDASQEQRKICEVNTGILASQTARLKSWLSELKNENAQKEYYLTDIVSIATREGEKIRAASPGQQWEVMGVNDKLQLAELERIFQNENAAELMRNGTTLKDPARFDLRGSLSCGKDVTIDVNCVFEGSVRLGDNVKIGVNSVLKNVEIMDGTEIAPFCHIEDAAIGRNCKIGPYARIRPGSQLEDAVHIGNFVEVKNSMIAEKSKANHLSYIGDATVGRNVNIGAGTITCNYDGANKHRTIIEDDAFIGSDTQLVAPVIVGKGATIGAGSTIVRNAPEGGLTLSRAKQMHIESWKRPVKKKD